ncbi:MAG TPA: hypothetical protein VG675_01430 [Bryobacteraceae bacterium]|nr:hypothetical protein [Bryobacteraceae bacterium]
MKRCVCLFLVCCALPLAAQETKPGAVYVQTAPPGVQKLFVLKYAEPDAIMRLLKVFDAKVVSDAGLHAIAVTASSQSMSAIEEAIQRLDVPSAMPKDISLTAYYVLGTGAPSATAAPTPKDLDSVLTQLKSTFPFKSYEMMDTLTTRARIGMGTDTSSLGAPSLGLQYAHSVNRLRFAFSSVSPDGQTIHLNGLRADSRIPVPTNSTGGLQILDIGINTDLDIREGQKVVVGRMGVGPDQALFLVLTAQLLN